MDEGSLSQRQTHEAEQPRTTSSQGIEVGETPSNTLPPVGGPLKQGLGIPGSSPLPLQFRPLGPEGPYLPVAFASPPRNVLNLVPALPMGISMAVAMPVTPNMAPPILASTNMVLHMPPHPAWFPPY